MNHSRLYPGIGHAILLIVAVLIVQVILSIPLAILAMATKSPLVSHPAVMAFISLVSFGLVLWLGAFQARAPLRELFPIAPMSAPVLLPVGLTILGVAILASEADNLMRAILPPPRALVELFANLTQARISFWGSYLALVIVAPLTEELLFRGLILRGFLSRYSVRVSVIVSAILFGALHLNPWQFVSAVMLGVVFAWWFSLTRSLVPCLVGHALANGLALAHSFLPVTIQGFNTSESMTSVEFQPLWFDALGLFLAVAGTWLFARWAPRAARPPIPPIINLAPPTLENRDG